MAFKQINFRHASSQGDEKSCIDNNLRVYSSLLAGGQNQPLLQLVEQLSKLVSAS